MNTQGLILALSAVAFASTTAANAAQFSYRVNDSTSTQVMTYPAVVQSSTTELMPTTTVGISPLSCAPLFGKHTYFDDDRMITRRTGMLGYGGMRVNEFSAVIPDASTTKICGQKLSNSMFDIRLFGFGLGLGRVTPRWDARPAGLAL